MTQLLSNLSRMQRIKRANQTILCKVKGSFVSRSFCIRYANIRVQTSQYKCFSTLCHGQKCLKATVSGAERKDQGVKRKQEKNQAQLTCSKESAGWNRRNRCTQQLVYYIDAEADWKSPWSWRKEIRENTMNATDHYVMINWIGHKTIPYIWASVAIITKACTLGMLYLEGLW